MKPENAAIEIRELSRLEEFRRCVELQREAFHLPDLELSPLRHLIVSINCGGFVLGAFAKNDEAETQAENLIGFVHHLVAVRENEIIGYSHMTAIANSFQNSGVGARLKWAQRAAALWRGQNFIKWTFDPLQARNAHFNLNRLGAQIRSYAENYYGTDYTTALPGEFGARRGLDSDRLFAEWNLNDETVARLARGETAPNLGEPQRAIEIPANWREIVKTDVPRARSEQLRVRAEFQAAFAENLVCAKFERGERIAKYLFYKEF